jgi:hypothetical protein
MHAVEAEHTAPHDPPAFYAQILGGELRQILRLERCEPASRELIWAAGRLQAGLTVAPIRHSLQRTAEVDHDPLLPARLPFRHHLADGGVIGIDRRVNLLGLRSGEVRVIGGIERLIGDPEIGIEFEIARSAAIEYTD